MTWKCLRVGFLLGTVLLFLLANDGCTDLPVIVGTGDPLGTLTALRVVYGLSFGTKGEVYAGTWENGQFVVYPSGPGSPGSNTRPNDARTATELPTVMAFPTTSPTGQGVALRASQGTSPVAGTIYMPDGFTKSVLVVDMATLQQTGKIPMSGTPFDVVVSPDRSTLYAATFPPAGGGTGAIAIVNLANQTVTGTIPLSGSYPQWLAISPDGTTLYCADNQGEYSTSSSAANQLLAIDLTAGKVKAAIPNRIFTESAIGRPVASPDGSTVYQPAFGAVLAIDTVSLQQSFSIPVFPSVGSQPASHTVITPDGRYLYVPTATGVAAVDAATGKSIASITVPVTSPVMQDVAISPDGGIVLAVDGVSGNLYQINPATNTIVATFGPGAGVTPNTGTNALLVLQ